MACGDLCISALTPLTRIQGDLRSLAQKVAKATASKVVHTMMRQSGGKGARQWKARPSALEQLEADAARNALLRYGP